MNLEGQITQTSRHALSDTWELCVERHDDDGCFLVFVDHPAMIQKILGRIERVRGQSEVQLFFNRV
jgi:hypothetical protein